MCVQLCTVVYGCVCTFWDGVAFVGDRGLEDFAHQHDQRGEHAQSLLDAVLEELHLHQRLVAHLGQCWRQTAAHRGKHCAAAVPNGSGQQARVRGGQGRWGCGGEGLTLPPCLASTSFCSASSRGSRLCLVPGAWIIISSQETVMFEVCCPPNSAATISPTTASSSGRLPSRYCPSTRIWRGKQPAIMPGRAADCQPSVPSASADCLKGPEGGEFESVDRLSSPGGNRSASPCRLRPGRRRRRTRTRRGSLPGPQRAPCAQSRLGQSDHDQHGTDPWGKHGGLARRDSVKKAKSRVCGVRSCVAAVCNAPCVRVSSCQGTTSPAGSYDGREELGELGSGPVAGAVGGGRRPRAEEGEV